MNIHNKLILALCASLVVMLQACSTDPSPWSQSSSPWAEQQDQAEAVPPVEEMEPLAQEPAPEVASAPVSDEIMYAPVEPVAAAPIEPVATAPIAEPVEREQAGAVAGSDIATMPAQYFTVQVCASRTLKQLKAFAKRNGLSDELTAKTSVKGETWYVLLQGVYPTRAEARQALAGVGQVATKPWVRSVASLQAVMSP